ncbi:hypothetical protein [Frigoriglobus tundricola]|uniref:Uncharacterized protein n=1 Tax=Frigoriglobus tundricola TaxID=2774151 RepID=A0A6M5Z4S7_9BACT|nr:hypothetical protein [Frigoriglobus tundricola]QJX00223.1 hypothetical protein FTUN_7847 [Frigoriglobus tundricola]
MNVFFNGDIHDGGGVVRAALRVRCAADEGSFYPKDAVTFEIGKVYHLIAEDRALAIRVTQLLHESSRRRTEVRFVTLGSADQHPPDPRPPAADGSADPSLLSPGGSDTDVKPAQPSEPAPKPCA